MKNNSFFKWLFKIFQKQNLPLELTVVDESPQLGLLEETELLFDDGLFNVKSW